MTFLLHPPQSDRRRDHPRTGFIAQLHFAQKRGDGRWKPLTHTVFHVFIPLSSKPAGIQRALLLSELCPFYSSGMQQRAVGEIWYRGDSSCNICDIERMSKPRVLDKGGIQLCYKQQMWHALGQWLAERESLMLKQTEKRVPSALQMQQNVVKITIVLLHNYCLQIWMRVTASVILIVFQVRITKG